MAPIAMSFFSMAPEVPFSLHNNLWLYMRHFFRWPRPTTWDDLQGHVCRLYDTQVPFLLPYGLLRAMLCTNGFIFAIAIPLKSKIYSIYSPFPSLLRMEETTHLFFGEHVVLARSSSQSVPPVVLLAWRAVGTNPGCCCYLALKPATWV